MKRTIMTTAAFAAVLFIGAGALAQNTYTDGTSDHKWSTAGNWSGGVPTAADNAVIPAGKTCNVDIVGAVADTVEVRGTLNIQANMKLTLDGDGSTSYVEGMGRIYLDDSGSELSFTSNNHTVTYVSSPGEIVGHDDDALLTVATTGITLTNKISISGSLEIQAASATFHNEGTVRADRNNGVGDREITCASGTYTGTTTGMYKVIASGSILSFSAGITTASANLHNDFEVTNGTLDINDDVLTTGDLTFTGGTIIVADEVTFAFNQ